MRERRIVKSEVVVEKVKNFLMEVVCPIDQRFASEISALLTPPSPHQVQVRPSLPLNATTISLLEVDRPHSFQPFHSIRCYLTYALFQDYFDELLSTRQCRDLKVKQNGDFGKGQLSFQFSMSLATSGFFQMRDGFSLLALI